MTDPGGAVIMSLVHPFLTLSSPPPGVIRVASPMPPSHSTGRSGSSTSHLTRISSFRSGRTASTCRKVATPTPRCAPPLHLGEPRAHVERKRERAGWSIPSWFDAQVLLGGKADDRGKTSRDESLGRRWRTSPSPKVPCSRLPSLFPWLDSWRCASPCTSGCSTSRRQ